MRTITYSIKKTLSLEVPDELADELLNLEDEEDIRDFVDMEINGRYYESDIIDFEILDVGVEDSYGEWNELC